LGSLLGYSPELVTLTRGWFGFIFKSPEDTMKVLEKTWVINGGSLMLKRWRVSFDSTNDYFQRCHLWVLLPVFHYNFGMPNALTAIGMSLIVSLWWMRKPSKGLIKIGKVLVEIDIHRGLLESIDIEWRGRVIGHKIGLSWQFL
jgi:hypothetical protein